MLLRHFTWTSQIWVSSFLKITLALANRAAEVDEWKQRYEAAIKATGQVLYDWDFQSNAVIWGGQCEDVLGILQPRCPIP